MKFSNLRIGAKLAGVFFLILALTAAVGAIAITQMGVMDDKTREITTNWMPSVVAIGDVRSAASFHRRTELQHTLSLTSDEMTRYDKDLAETRTRLAKLIADYDMLVVNAEERAQFDAFKKSLDGYLSASAKLIALSWKGEAALDETKAFLRGPSGAAYLATDAALEKIVEFNRKNSALSGERAGAAYTHARLIVVALLACAIVLAVVLATWITRLITRPLAAAVAAAGRIAQGDLTVELSAHGRDECAQLLRALAAMTENLRRVVAGVRGNAEGVATASQQIADGNTDLSARTEEQASSLEETASSMEELTSAVKQNADSAFQGNQLAQAASTVAAHGGHVVEQVVSTMREINDSSRRIADIITVIDGIAFQTNILALNAAVEAARAGEAGRGFAVVAGEVRTLAQRSADAAREIKGLITTSVERVESGTALADQAGSTMREVVTSIQRVTDVMGEITAASHEQSTGIGQVSEAVSQMDQVTQQNAALVEEASAAAESLRVQAAELVTAVSAFRIAREQPAQASSAAVLTPVRLAAPSERRSHDRAKNVVRIAPKAVKPAVIVQADRQAAVIKATGTDDNWQTF